MQKLTHNKNILNSFSINILIFTVADTIFKSFASFYIMKSRKGSNAQTVVKLVKRLLTI